MREIASRAGVTVSNIYHYFTNKDEIFRTILKPVLNDLYAMIYNHDADQMTIDVFMDSDYQKMSVREYIRLVSEHRDRLRLLLFQAQGSVLENFRSEYTDLMTILGVGPERSMGTDYFSGIWSSLPFTKSAHFPQASILPYLYDSCFPDRLNDLFRGKLCSWRDA